jgi:hypothetical protein
MKIQAACVALAISLPNLGAPAFALSIVSPTTSTSTKTSALQKEVSLSSPSTLAAPTSSAKRHLFPVNDEKGLLLTCIAPEIETNRDTDIFNNCTLAPGRTLDDVMHSFIHAIHQEQQEQFKAQQHAESQPSSAVDAKDRTAQKNGQR